MNYPSLRQIQSFLAIARLRSFGAAAAELCVTPSALSQSITLMEEMLGGRLFDRTTRSVELTALGRMLLPGAQRIEAELRRTFGEVQEMTSLARGSVAMGCLASITVRVMPGIIAAFRKEHPGILVQVRDDNAAGLSRKLLAGEIEFAVTSPARLEASIAFRRLAEDPFRLLCPPGHPLARHCQVEWAALREHAVIGFAPETSNRLNIDRALATAGVQLSFAMELSQLGTVVGMVRSGIGVAALPSMACPESDGLVSVPLRNPAIAREVGIATLAGRSLPPAASALAAAIAAWFARQLS
jgi:DNA-binding transcriptional LysR family regulator